MWRRLTPLGARWATSSSSLRADLLQRASLPSSGLASSVASRSFLQSQEASRAFHQSSAPWKSDSPASAATISHQDDDSKSAENNNALVPSENLYEKFWTYAPFVGAGTIIALSKEIYILNEETMILGCFAGAIWAMYLNLGDAFRDTYKEHVNELTQEMDEATGFSIELQKAALESITKRMNTIQNLRVINSQFVQSIQNMEKAVPIMVRNEINQVLLQQLSKMHNRENTTRVNSSQLIIDKLSNDIYKQLQSDPKMKEKYWQSAMNPNKRAHNPVPDMYKAVMKPYDIYKYLQVKSLNEARPMTPLNELPPAPMGLRSLQLSHELMFGASRDSAPESLKQLASLMERLDQNPTSGLDQLVSDIKQAAQAAKHDSQVQQLDFAHQFVSYIDSMLSVDQLNSAIAVYALCNVKDNMTGEQLRAKVLDTLSADQHLDKRVREFCSKLAQIDLNNDEALQKLLHDTKVSLRGLSHAEQFDTFRSIEQIAEVMKFSHQPWRRNALLLINRGLDGTLADSHEQELFDALLSGSSSTSSVPLLATYKNAVEDLLRGNVLQLADAISRNNRQHASAVQAITERVQQQAQIADTIANTAAGKEAETLQQLFGDLLPSGALQSERNLPNPFWVAATSTAHAMHGKSRDQDRQVLTALTDFNQNRFMAWAQSPLHFQQLVATYQPDVDDMHRLQHPPVLTPPQRFESQDSLLDEMVLSVDQDERVAFWMLEHSFRMSGEDALGGKPLPLPREPPASVKGAFRTLGASSWQQNEQA